MVSGSIKLENTATAGTITVKFVPPSVDIAQLAEDATAGNGGYR